MKKLLRGGFVVTPRGSRRADVLLDGEKIAQVGHISPAEAKSAEVTDVSGCYLFPGFIDAHTHFDLDVCNTTTADDFASGTRSAIRGGTTTIIDFACPNKGETLAYGLDLWHKKADGKCSCDYGFHMTIDDWNEGIEGELDDMFAAGITSFKMYLTYPAMMIGDGAVYSALKALKKRGGIAGVHCENAGVIDARIAELKAAGRAADVSAHPEARPDYLEAEAVARLLRIAEAADAPVVIVHLTNREALDEVYVDVPMDSGESFIPYLDEMESMGLTVHFRLPLLDRIEEACCDETSAARLSRSLGRCAGGNIVSIPIIAVVAIPLKLESPGPLFFKQKRVGRNGRYFYIHKLRSMYVDAEARKKELMAQNEMNGLMFKMEDDPRVTKVGKFIRRTSIDELPQFFDVVRGSMSLVGTRPPTLDEYRQYESHHKRRLSMKPGITGLWQVSGRSDIEDFEDVVKLDVQYIDNWSLWGDIKILFKTVWVVFAGRGAK